MAIYVVTEKPNTLLRKIKEAIATGKIESWIHDPDGYFTYKPEPWRRKAWLMGKKTPTGLVFNIVKPKSSNVSSATYAVYHGRFVEALLRRFDTLFDSASASAYPEDGDRVS